MRQDSGWSDQFAKQYEEMVQDAPGPDLTEWVLGFVPAGSTILELGMGPGADQERLSRRFQMVGSDVTEYFVERAKTRDPGGDYLRLDAVTLETDRSFDALFANKVLMHLGPEEFRASLLRQADIAPWSLFTLWSGAGAEDHGEAHFEYYAPERLEAAAPPIWEVVSCEPYGEMQDGDSLRVALRRRRDN